MGDGADLFLRVHVQERSFRVHLHGSEPNVQAVVDSWTQIMGTVQSEGDAVRAISSLCQEQGVMMGDLLDLEPASPSQTVAQQMRVAAHARDAESAFIMIDGILSGVTDDEIMELIQSSDLVWVRDLIQGVVENLDESAVSARERLASHLPEPAQYLLLS